MMRTQYKLEITTHDAGDGTLTAIVVLTNTKTEQKFSIRL